ncbi:MAG: CHAT domain-containing protein [Thainema sp.]
MYRQSASKQKRRKLRWIRQYRRLVRAGAACLVVLLFHVVGLAPAIATHPTPSPHASRLTPHPHQSPAIPQQIAQTTTDPPFVVPTITRGIAVVERVQEIEQTWKTDYTEYLGSPSDLVPQTGVDVAATLAKLSTETNHQLGLIYVFPHEEGLELLLVTPDGASSRHLFPDVPQSRLLDEANQLKQMIARLAPAERYLPSAQQLYEWIITPIEPELQAAQIDTLVFCVGGGVRSLPLSVLHDGQQFLIEKYDVGLIPAFTLTDQRYRPMRTVDVLAMGASEFQTLGDLPAVPVELSAIASDIWPGEIYLNDTFTRQNLQQELEQRQFEIVHLATHAEFRSGAPSESFIQLWQNEQITLAQIRDLDWENLPVELLVLSACQTALGNPEAELGFAGLAYQAGVKSTLASLWSVSDVGTLALMREFYWQLAQADGATKANVLGLTQRAMIHGEVQLTDQQLRNSGGTAIAFPASLQNMASSTDLSHPFYWAAFVLVGSPW